MMILREPDGGSGGAGDSGLAMDKLSVEAQAVVKAKGWKSLGDVVTSYSNLEKTLGADKILAPQKNWGDKEWGEFFGRAGRPQQADQYEVPADVKLNEGLKLDDGKMKVAKETFHKLGLTATQGRELMKFYLGTLNESDSALKTQRQSEITSGMDALRKAFGDKVESKIDQARAVVQKFGGEDLVKYLDESGLGNHPSLISAFAKIGDGMLEDHATGSGEGLNVKDSTRALQEIKQLSYDADFQKALNDRMHVGHQAAVERWLELHKIAHPTKPVAED